MCRIFLFIFSLTISLADTALAGEYPKKEDPKIVCTTSLIHDWLSQILGPKHPVGTLIPQEADPHAFELSPQGRVKLEEADLVFAHGQGFEGHLLDTLKTIGSQKLIYLSDPISGPLHPAVGAHKEEHLEQDPHTWMDPLLVLPMIDKICEALCRHMPSKAPIYQEKAEQYKKELKALDVAIQHILSALPLARRYLICQHDNLSHFSKRYKFTVLATVHTHNEEPSASHYKHLLNIIQDKSICAIFYDPREEDRLIKNLAYEAKITAQPLLVEGLHAKAQTYTALMDYTAQTLVSALKD